MNIEVIIQLLSEMPTNRRLAFLMYTLIIDDKAALTIENLLDTALCMLRHLPEKSQRTRVAWYLANALSELDDLKWN